MKKFKHIIVIILCLIMLFPFVFVIIGSTHDSSWAFKTPMDFSFGQDFIKNFVTLKNNYNIFQVVFVSFLTALLTSLISVIVIGLASYAFSKYDFKGNKIMQVFFISFALIPQPTYLIGQLEIINTLNLYSTFLGLVVPFVINLHVLILMKNTCCISKEIMEAARIDGASECQIIMRVSMPLMKDKLLIAFFLLFIASWNNFLIPMIITTDSRLFTIPILTSGLADPMSYDIGSVFMSLLFAIIPVTVVFLLLQKRIFKDDTLA